MAELDYKSFKEQLTAGTKWPLKYMFKFIVPNAEGKVAKVVALLPKHGKLSFKHTDSLKFVSVTCVALMNTPDEIIDITKSATSVNGVMAL